MAGIVKYTRSASCLRILRFPLSALPSTCGYGYGVKIAVLDECLHRLAPTLEKLVLEISTPGSILFDTKGTEYLALRSLTMGIEDGLVRMDILVHKFPALDGTLDVRSSCMQDDEPKQQQIRASNQEHQKRQSWRHLDCVMGNVLALFTLGLTCPVRRLVLDGFRTHKKSHLVEILRSAPPTHFNLSVLLDRWNADDGHNDVFLGLFPPEVLPRLTHLVLVLDYGIFPENVRETDAESMHWHALLADIISSISGLHLTHLRLVVHYCIDLTTDEDEDEDDPVDYSKDFVRSIVDIDHEHLATELMAAIPSLQHIFIGTGGSFVVDMRPSEPIVNEDWPHGFDPRGAGTRGRWFAHSAWRPSYVGIPRRLHTVEMDRKLLEEDLVLSKNDNFSLGFQKTWSAEETAPWPLPE
ncbi:uncharacterized protein TRAVEDRAFT_51304 [Trametes versicolor FP-101664 SS1]|uniref:uncharacterized protein n=1 Tax=Trametes versicolor (strain FP-101664) TaxID=717944 RepID=UPI00046230A9|nr:uncharacterized protein TRAVEDRAFT_51304 [Trametes versicolor FP-101664 SS1]EIW55175.1 hypothetical protein TRAVEDRAFT_51304 [Trametes versicolor FP-101664 SS1]